MGLNPELALHSNCMIAPASPTPKASAHLFLSCLDIMWQDVHYNRRLLFYPNNQLKPMPVAADAVELLKRSLSQVLVYFYPLAGRLALDPHKRLFLDCNDSGVEFVEASIDFPMSHLRQQGFQMKAFFEKLCRDVDHKDEKLYTSPLLSVQATRFNDGGLAVAVAVSHVVADGQSLWDFMVGWGECARGEKLRREPVHERRRLAVERPSEAKAKLNFLAAAAEEEVAEQGEEEEGGGEEGAGSGGKEEGIPMVQSVFILPAAALGRLKEEAGAEYSTYVALCAHVWQRLTAARALPRGATSTQANIANLRARLEPPLPASYFGNALYFGGSAAGAGRLSTERLGLTAARVRAAVATAQDLGLLSDFMHWLELHGGRAFGHVTMGAAGVHVTSSPRFPAYHVDFGWGQPCAVRPVKVHGNGEVVLFGGCPELPAGHVEVCTCLPAPVMQRLLHDHLFLAYAPSSPLAADS